MKKIKMMKRTTKALLMCVVAITVGTSAVLATQYIPDDVVIYGDVTATGTTELQDDVSISGATDGSMGRLNVGTNDSKFGQVVLYSNASSAGPQVYMATNPDHDDYVASWCLDVIPSTANFRLRTSGGSQGTKSIFEVDDETLDFELNQDLRLKGTTAGIDYDTTSDVLTMESEGDVIIKLGAS